MTHCYFPKLLFYFSELHWWFVSCWKWFWKSRCNNLSGNEPTPSRYHTSKWPWALWAQSRQFSTTGGIFDSGYRESLTETTVRAERGARKITVQSLWWWWCNPLHSTRVTAPVPHCFQPLGWFLTISLFNGLKIVPCGCCISNLKPPFICIETSILYSIIFIIIRKPVKERKENGHRLQVTWYYTDKT